MASPWQGAGPGWELEGTGGSVALKKAPKVPHHWSRQSAGGFGKGKGRLSEKCRRRWEEVPRCHRWMRFFVFLFLGWRSYGGNCTWPAMISSVRRLNCCCSSSLFLRHTGFSFRFLLFLPVHLCNSLFQDRGSEMIIFNTFDRLQNKSGNIIEQPGLLFTNYKQNIFLLLWHFMRNDLLIH